MYFESSVAACFRAATAALNGSCAKSVAAWATARMAPIAAPRSFSSWLSFWSLGTDERSPMAGNAGVSAFDDAFGDADGFGLFVFGVRASFCHGAISLGSSSDGSGTPACALTGVTCSFGSAFTGVPSSGRSTSGCDAAGSGSAAGAVAGSGAAGGRAPPLGVMSLTVSHLDGEPPDADRSSRTRMPARVSTVPCVSGESTSCATQRTDRVSRASHVTIVPTALQSHWCGRTS